MEYQSRSSILVNIHTQDELEEEETKGKEKMVYEDYKFVTVEELEKLGVAKTLVGTPYLRAYMHGYFIDVRLYNKVREIADPFAYEEYRKQRIAEKMDQLAKTRISAAAKNTKKKQDKNKQKKVAVNQAMAERLASDRKAIEDKERVSSDSNPLDDDRFSALFNDPKFIIDEDSLEYQRTIAKVASKEKKKRSRDEEFELIDEDDQLDYEKDASAKNKTSTKKRPNKSTKSTERIDNSAEKPKKLLFYESKVIDLYRMCESVF